MRTPGYARIIAAPLATLVLGFSAVAAARDPLDTNEPQPLSRPYRPGTIGLGFTLNPFFFLNPRNGLDLGPTVKVFLPKAIPVAFEALLGFGSYTGGLGFQLDGLYEAPRLHENDFYSVNWYAGLGVNLGSFGDCGTGACPLGAFGAHGVLGMGWLLSSAPLEIIADWRPGFVAFTSATYSYIGPSLLSFSFAGRYFF